MGQEGARGAVQVRPVFWGCGAEEDAMERSTCQRDWYFRCTAFVQCCEGKSFVSRFVCVPFLMAQSTILTSLSSALDLAASISQSHRGLNMAKAKLDMPKSLKTLGYINPCNVKLRLPYTFAWPPLPEVTVAHPQAASGPAAKPKPRAAPKKFSITRFLKSN